MSEKTPAEVLFEPERYELGGGPSYHFEWSRREFFKGLGGGILVISVVKDSLALQESGRGRRRGSSEAMPSEIGAWLHIAEDEAVTVYTGKVEVGQDIRTSLGQVVAEELQLSLPAIRLVMGDTDLTPFDMGTFGSMTTPVMAAQLRKVSAVARETLLDLAAEQSKGDRRSFIVSDGKVIHTGTHQSFTFGQLTKGRELLKLVGENVPTTPPDQWRVAGKAAARVSGRLIVTGTHRYTSDLKRPEMLVGKILRPPAFGATLISLVTRDAEGIAGVTVVRDGAFVGTTAPSELVALQALKALRTEWKTVPQPSSPELFRILKTQPTGQQDVDDRSDYTFGSIKEGMAAAQVKLTQSYTVAYIAHAPLEPRAAVAEWKDGKLTVWTGTQRPFGVRTELAEAFRVPEKEIRVIVPDTGSAYGGKHSGEAAIEAARLAKAAGKPVKLVWTREEEFTWAYFRPAGVIDVASGVDADGKITAWEFHNYNSGNSGIQTLYEAPNRRVEFHRTSSPLRQGSYRALASTANHFARESHMDDMAHAVKMDPLEFRLKNLKDARLRAVLQAAAETFGWGRGKTSSERGFGIAGGTEKGGYVATCAEVAIANGSIKVSRVVTAFECGAILNPDHLKNQVEGGIMMGIGGAMFEAIEFENGKILNPRLSKYRVPRFSDMPVIETVLLDRKDLPSAGAGESPLIALAPAIGNAIFQATGKRLRSLPMAI